MYCVNLLSAQKKTKQKKKKKERENLGIHGVCSQRLKKKKNQKKNPERIP